MEPLQVDTKAHVEGESVEVETGERWRRLSAIAIFYFSFHGIIGMAQGLIYVVPAVAVTINITDSIGAVNTYLAFIGFLALIVLNGVVSFYMYRFRVHNQHIEIQSGVFSKSYVNLPFWRIQNVKIERPFYYRPFGYALVVLDTAGSAAEEANIVAVPVGYAHALRKQVLAEHDEHKNIADPSIDAMNNKEDKSEALISTADEVVLNRRSISDIIIHGITNNRIWIFLGAGAPFYDDIFSVISNWLAQKGLQLNQIVGEATIAWWQLGLYVLVIMLMAMAGLAFISIGGALFTFYDYTLSRHNDRYIRRSGLLNKQEVSMRASRIQVISAKQDWLDRVLKRVNLYFEQNATVGQSGQELMSPNRLIVPSVTENEAITLSQEVMPESEMYRNDYQQIDKHYIWHWSLLAVLGPFLLGVGGAVFSQHWDILFAILVLAILAFLVIVLRWWRWGIARDKRYIYVRRGRIGVDYCCFEPYKVQQIIVKQSVFMKKRRLASIQFVLASGVISVPFLNEDAVNKMVDDVLFDIESTRKSWM